MSALLGGSIAVIVMIAVVIVISCAMIARNPIPQPLTEEDYE